MEKIGLCLNCAKSEIISSDRLIIDSVLLSLPGAQVIEPTFATLLGSPLGNEACVSVALDKKVNNLAKMRDRLALLIAHDSLLLLHNSFFIPKLLYLLRTVPCFLSPNLTSYDKLLSSIVGRICNVHMTTTDTGWSQAYLPVRSGGLGLRSAVQLAPSAFMSSAAASKKLMSQILPAGSCFSVPEADTALICWYNLFPGTRPPPPSGDDVKIQKAWDSLVVRWSFEHLHGATDEMTRARLLSVSTPESGAWLHALPIVNLGLRIFDSTIRVAVGLRLGLPLALPHSCCHCCAMVDEFATHPLSCKKSEGRFFAILLSIQ